MANCEEFLNGIRQINFSDITVKFRKIILLHALKELKRQKNTLDEKVLEARKIVPSEGLETPTQVKVKEYIAHLESELRKNEEQIKRVYQQEPSLEASAGDDVGLMDSTFIANFSTYFRDISHLVTTLSDAPESIKNIQTQLYFPMLSKLTKEEQERQLAKLNPSQLKDLLTQVIAAYKKEDDGRVRHGYQSLAHLIVFAIVQRECDIAKTIELDPTKNYEQYKKIVLQIDARLPSIGSLQIFDSFSQYRSSEHKSIRSLLGEVRSHFNIRPEEIWEKGIDSAKIERKVFQKLRYGQQDRRDYADKRRANLKRDLFWARDIRDIEAFKNDGVSDGQYQEIRQRKYLRVHESKYRWVDMKGGGAQQSNEELSKRKLQLALDHLTLKIGENALATFLRDTTRTQKTSSSAPELIKKHLNASLSTVLHALHKPERFDNLITKLAKVKDESTSINAFFNDISDKQVKNELLKALFLNMYRDVSNSDLPKATLIGRAQRVSEEELAQLLDSGLREPFCRPEIATEDSNNQLMVRLSYLNPDVLKGFKDWYKTTIVPVTGKSNDSLMGRESYKIMEEFLKNKGINLVTATTTREFRGRTLDDIEKQIGCLTGVDKNTKESYSKNIDDILHEIDKDSKEPPTIFARGLGSQELLFRKLLELYYLKEHLGENSLFTSSECLEEVFKSFREGEFLAFQKSELAKTLEADVERAYSDLEAQDPDLKNIDQKLRESIPAEVRKNIHTILKKAGALVQSNLDKEERAKELDQFLLTKELNETQRIELLSDLYIREYVGNEKSPGVIDHFKVTPEQIIELKQSIREMAKEVVRLITRVESGQPVFSSAEEEAYYNVIGQVVQQISAINDKHNIKPPKTMNDYRFTIPALVTGQQSIELFSVIEGESPISININIPIVESEANTGPANAATTSGLPYALIKPLGQSELTFSYGGARGVIAPFEKFDTIIGQISRTKPRFFTHGRLLGVGQYGSVLAVEQFLSGLNYAVKQGIVETKDSMQPDKELQDCYRARGLTSKPESKSVVEACVLTALADAEKTAHSSDVAAHYWSTEETLLSGRKLILFHILMPRAQGETFAETASKALSLRSNTDPQYHNPIARNPSVDIFKERLALSEAILREAVRLRDLGFTHNDIKPENFLYKKQDDGSYQVQFIDWATAGFRRNYSGAPNKPLLDVFKEMFQDVPKEPIAEVKEGKLEDAQGRFVEAVDGQIKYGINPRLEILHGARNGTLPYISPLAIAEGRACVAAKIIDPSLTTKFNFDEAKYDNYALTAMQFGICSRHAYFNLVKGRIVGDYAIPGVLEADRKTPEGLKVVDYKPFNELFSCDPSKNANDESDLDDKTAVMYIPGSAREGEPLHLFRHLKQLQNDLSHNIIKSAPDIATAVESIQLQIKTVLDTVTAAIASGEGLNPHDLQKQLQLAQQCVSEYERLKTPALLVAAKKPIVLQAIFGRFAEGQVTLEVLKNKLQDQPVPSLDALCFYPETAEEKSKAISILQRALPIEERAAREFDNICLDPEKKLPAGRVPFYADLLKNAIEHKQSGVVQHFLKVISLSQNKTEWFTVIKEQGLLHYALEQGMTEVFKEMVVTLKKLDPNIDMFAFMMEIPHQPQIRWAANALHTALRNNSKEQVVEILQHLPGVSNPKYSESLKEALHFSAWLGNSVLYTELLAQYNKRYPQNKITEEEILGIKTQFDHHSPYHLFLRDQRVSSVTFDALKTFSPAIQRNFLLGTPSPMLIAASSGNEEALSKLLDSIGALKLEPGEKNVLFNQRDSQGFNLLNHVLEQFQFSGADRLIQKISALLSNDKVATSAAVSDLLSGVKPINPLAKYLKEEGISIEEKYKVLNLFLNTMSADHILNKSVADSDQTQGNRLVSMWANEDWLLEQANCDPVRAELETLIRSKGLSDINKALLCDRLMNAANRANPPKRVAAGYFNKLLNEFTKQAPGIIADLKTKEEYFRMTQRVANIQNMPFDALTEMMKRELEIARLTTEQKKSAEALKSLQNLVARSQFERIEIESRALIYNESLSGLIEIGAKGLSTFAKQVSLLEGELQTQKEGFDAEVIRITETSKVSLQDQKNKFEAMQRQFESRLADAAKQFDNEKATLRLEFATQKEVLDIELDKALRIGEELADKLRASKEKAKSSAAEVDELQLNVQVAESTISSLKTKLDMLTSQHQKDLGDMQHRLEGNIRALQDELARQRTKHEEEKARIQHELKQQFDAAQKTHESKLSSIHQRLKGLSGSVTEPKQLPDEVQAQAQRDIAQLQASVNWADDIDATLVSMVQDKEVDQRAVEGLRAELLKQKDDTLKVIDELLGKEALVAAQLNIIEKQKQELTQLREETGRKAIQIEQVSGELGRFREQMLEQIKHAQELQDQLGKAQIDITEFERQIAERDEKIKELKELKELKEHSELESKDRDRQLAGLETEKGEAQVSLEKANLQITGLKSELHQAQQSLREQREQLLKLSQQVSAVEQQKEQGELVGRSKFENLRALLGDAEAQFKQVQHELTAERQKSTSLDEAIRQLAGKLSDREKNLQAINEDFLSKETQLGDAQRQLADLQMKLKSSEKDAIERRALEEKTKALSDQISGFSSELMGARTQIDQLEHDIEDKKREKEQLEDQNRSLHEEVLSFKSILVDSEGAYNQISSQLTEVKDKHESSQRELVKTQDNLRDTTAEVLKLQAQLVAACDNYAQEKKRIEAQQEEIGVQYDERLRLLSELHSESILSLKKDLFDKIAAQLSLDARLASTSEELEASQQRIEALGKEKFDVDQIIARTQTELALKTDAYALLERNNRGLVLSGRALDKQLGSMRDDLTHSQASNQKQKQQLAQYKKKTKNLDAALTRSYQETATLRARVTELNQSIAASIARERQLEDRASLLISSLGGANETVLVLKEEQKRLQDLIKEQDQRHEKRVQAIHLTAERTQQDFNDVLSRAQEEHQNFVRDLKTQLDRAQVEYRNVESARVQLGVELASLKVNHKVLQEQLEQSKGEVSSLQKELSIAQREGASSKEQLEIAAKTLEEVVDEANKTSQSLRLSEITLAEHRQQVTELRGVNQQLQERNGNLQKMTQSLQHRLDELTDSLSIQERAAKQASEELNAAIVERDGFREQFFQLSTKLNENEAEYKAKVTELQNQKSTEKQIELKALQEEHAQKQARLNAQLKNAHQKTQELTTTIDELRQESTKKDEQIHRMQQQLGAQHTEILGLKKVQEELNTKARALVRANAELEGQYKSATRQVESQQLTIAFKEEEILRLRDKVQDAQKNSSDLERQLKQMNEEYEQQQANIRSRGLVDVDLTIQMEAAREEFEQKILRLSNTIDKLIAERNGFENDLSTKNGELAQAQQGMLALQKRKQELELSNDQLLAQLTLANTESGTQREELQQIRNRQIQLDAQLAKTKATLDRANELSDKQKHQLDEYARKNSELVLSVDDFKAQVQRLEAKVAQLESVIQQSNEKEKNLNTNLKDLTDRLSVADRAVQNAFAEQQRLQDEIQAQQQKHQTDVVLIRRQNATNMDIELKRANELYEAARLETQQRLDDAQKLCRDTQTAKDVLSRDYESLEIKNLELVESNKNNCLQLVRLKAELAEKDRANIDMCERLKNSEEKLLNITERSKEHTKQLADSKVTMDGLNSKLNELAEKNQSLSQENATLTKRVQQLESQLENTTEDLKLKTRSIVQFEQRHVLAQKSIDNLTRHSEALRDQLKSVREANTQQAQEIVEQAKKAIEDKLADLSALGDKHMSESAGLKKQIQDIVAEKEAALADLARQYSLEKKELQNKITGLETDSAKLASKCEEQKKSLREMEQSIAIEQGRLSQVTKEKERLEAMLKDREDLSAQEMDEMTRRISNLTGQYQQAQLDNQLIRSRALKAESQNKNLLQKVGALSDENRQIKIQLGDLKSTVSDLENQLKQAKKQIASFGEERVVASRTRALLVQKDNDLKIVNHQFDLLTDKVKACEIEYRENLQQIRAQSEKDKTTQEEKLRESHEREMKKIRDDLEVVTQAKSAVDQEVIRLAQQLSDKNAKITELDSKLDEAMDLISSSKDTTTLQSAEIRRLTTEFDEARGALNQMKESNDALLIANKQLKDDVEALNANIALAKEHLQTTEQRVVILHEMLQSMFSKLPQQSEIGGIARGLDFSQLTLQELQKHLQTLKESVANPTPQAESVSRSVTANGEQVQFEEQSEKGPLEERLSRLTEELNKARKTISDQLAQQHDILEWHKEEVAGLFEAQEILRREIREKESLFETRLSALTEKSEEIRQPERANHQAAMVRFKKKIVELRAAKTRVDDQLKEKLVRIDEQQQAMSEVNARFEAYKDEHEAMHYELITLQGNNLNLMRQFAEQKKLIEELENEKRQNIAEGNKLSNAQSSVLEQMKELDARNKTLLNDNTELTERLRLANEANEAGQITQKEFENRIAQLEQELRVERETSRVSPATASAVQKELGTARRTAGKISSANPRSFFQSGARRVEQSPSSTNNENNSLHGTIISGETRVPSGSQSKKRQFSNASASSSHNQSAVLSNSPFYNLPPTPCKLYAILDERKIPKSEDMFIGASKVIQVEFPSEVVLEEEQLKDVASKSGLKLFSPSGHNYQFSLAEKQPKAMLSADVTNKRSEGDDEAKHQEEQRLAVTIMNMIDNVLVHGANTVNVDTDDPFVSGVAEGYIAYLKGKGVIVNGVNITPYPGHEAQKKGLTVFEYINTDLMKNPHPAIEERIAKQRHPTQAIKKAINLGGEDQHAQGPSLSLSDDE